MELPVNLETALREELASISVTTLKQAVLELSEQYRGNTPEKRAGYQSTHHRLAYLAVRFPATFAANIKALTELFRLKDIQSSNPCPSSNPPTIESILDLGAGPGTAAFAASTLFPEVNKVTLIERDPEMIKIGIRLQGYLTKTGSPWIWHAGDLLELAKPSRHIPNSAAIPVKADLVIASYCLGELPKQSITALISLALSSANKFVAFIEPGTPEGFSAINYIRDQLLSSAEWSIVAPCTHSNQCPLNRTRSEEDSQKWCHFPARLNRTNLHQLVKQGSLSYEDEKFSYLIVGRSEYVPAHRSDPKDDQLIPARIIGHPRHQKGLVRLDLCTRSGQASTLTVSKREKRYYKESKKKGWGELLLGNTLADDMPE